LLVSQARAHTQEKRQRYLQLIAALSAVVTPFDIVRLVPSPRGFLRHFSLRVPICLPFLESDKLLSEK
jgi:hypothetical protein